MASPPVLNLNDIDIDDCSSDRDQEYCQSGMLSIGKFVTNINYMHYFNDLSIYYIL